MVTIFLLITQRLIYALNFRPDIVHHPWPIQLGQAFLLTAICIPVIFFEDEQHFRGLWLNAYFYAALFTAVFFMLSKRILISSIAGFMLFYLLQYFILL